MCAILFSRSTLRASLVFLFSCASFIVLAQKPLIDVSKITATKAVGNKFFFAADDGQHGMELWISDGSEEGTRMLKDINPKPYSSSTPANFAEYNGLLYFSAYTDQYQTELWKSDGTESGTQLVIDLVPGGGYYEGANPMALTAFKGFLYFSTSQGVYRTDGSAAGTTLVQSVPSLVISFVPMGDYLYFLSYQTIYRTNGTVISEIPVPHREPDDGMYIQNLYATKDKLFALSGPLYFSTIRLHVLNESATDWTLIKEYQSSAYNDQQIDHFIAIDDKLFFTRRSAGSGAVDELWVTNGTDTATVLLKSFAWESYWSQSEAMNHFAYNGALYFRAPEKSQKALWRSDGTVEGTQQFSTVVMTNPYNGISLPAFVNGRAYFCGNGSIWSTDGSTAGTVKEFQGGDEVNYPPMLFTAVGDLLYYVTEKQFAATLWNTSPAPEIDVTVLNTPIANGGSVLFQSVLTDDCYKTPITIGNLGRQELMIADVHVTGNDFFLNGSVPEVIAAGAKITFDAFFHPLSTGSKTADLYISTNDDNEAQYKIKLTGTTLNSSARGVCQSFNNKSSKSLVPAAAAKAIKLSNTDVREAEPAGTTVGTLSVPNWDNATYSLVNGTGSEDNRHFSVSGNVLSTNRPFHSSSKRMYTLRLKAVHGTDSKEEFFTINVRPQLPSFAGETCAPNFRRYDRALMGIALNSVGDLFTVDTDGDIARSSDDGISWKKVGDGRGGWQSMLFFKNTKGYYISDGGILKSDDDGATWFQVFLPQVPMSASFLDEETGYVSGGNGELFYTTNGGRTWTSRGVSGDALRSFHFRTTEKGIGIRSYSDIVVTEDAGKTWTRSNVTLEGWNPHVLSVYFINESTGFIATDYALHQTTDGGKTWKVVPDVSLSGYVPVIKFIDNNNGYLFASNLYTTSDGGKSWSEKPIPGPPSVTGAAWSASKHTLYTSNGMYNNYYYGRAVNKSTDEGDTWQSLFTSPQVQFSDVEFPAEDIGYAFGPNGNYKTTDQGMTWKALDWATPAANAVFFDENTGLISDNLKIYKTVNGGETVDMIYELTQDPDHYRTMGQLYSVTPTLLFTYGWQSLYRSADGGYHWQLISEYDGIIGLSFVSPTTGYLMVSGGGVRKTTDGGLTWSTVYTPADADYVIVSKLLFIDEQVGFRAGDHFDKTTDGGVTWKRMDSGIGSISYLQFADALHGYAMTSDKRIYESSNGGVSWKQLPIYDLPNTYRFEYRNHSVYMCGENGFVARLTEGTVTPSQPGYISGPNEVCRETTQSYALPEINNVNRSLYNWSVSGTAILKSDGTTANIEFPREGTYTVTVDVVNACGNSESRSLDVVSLGVPEPVINGKTTVAPKELGVRYDLVDADPSLAYQWYATGGTASTTSPLFTMVNWNESAADAKVSAIATDVTHGCRTAGTLKVMIDQTIVGVEDEWDAEIDAYPNPVEDELRIRSFMNFPLIIRIYNAQGREFQSSELEEFGDTTIDLRKLPAGLYILEIRGSGDGQSYSRRIIKK